MRKILAILLCCTMLTGGCAALAPVGAVISAGTFWLNGEAHKYYNTDIEAVHAATLQALAELQFPIIKTSKSPGYIYITAGDTDKFKITIHQVRYNITKLSCRVNLIGDKPYAELLYKKVDKHPAVQEFGSAGELNSAMRKRRR